MFILRDQETKEKKKDLESHIRMQIKKAQTSDFEDLEKWVKKNTKGQDRMDEYFVWFMRQRRAAKTAEEGKKEG